MNNSDQHQPATTPLEHIEPHAGLLTTPSMRQTLYKIMSAENLLRSVTERYLHFNRVDSYSDFQGADPHDGCQLPKDCPGNASSRLLSDPRFTAEDLYHRSRARTYACSFSMESSDYIWSNYANNNRLGKVCVVFEFGKLRKTINDTWHALRYQGNRYRQIFSVNYGMVKYVEWSAHQENSEHLPNPITYTYIKDRRQFAEDREFRISLSANGIWRQFVLPDGTAVEFPSSMQLEFDFHAAIANGAIVKIVRAPGTHTDFLKSELEKLHIVLSDA